MQLGLNLKHTLISYFYLFISLLGAIFTTTSNIKFANLYGPGFDLSKFILLATNNPASQSLSFDLLFLATAIFAWMIIESKRLEINNFWIIILGTFIIAIAFSAPLFLFLRERRILEINRNKLC